MTGGELTVGGLVVVSIVLAVRQLFALHAGLDELRDRLARIEGRLNGATERLHRPDDPSTRR